VVSALEQVADAVDRTGLSAATALEVSEAMQSASAHLRDKVERFLSKVAA